MKLGTLGITMGLIASAGTAWGAERTITKMNAANFAKLTPADLSAGDIKYAPHILRAKDWSEKYPEASELLALYPGYKEALQWSKKDGVLTSRPEPLVFYFARTRTVLKRAATAIDLSTLIKYQNIKALVPELIFADAPIQRDQFVATYVQKHQVPPSFTWANKGDVLVARTLREINLDQSLPPASKREPWCSRAGRTLCFEAVMPIVDGAFRLAFDMANKMYPADQKKDPAQALQAEVRYLLSEAEGGYPKGAFDAITQVGTPVTGLAELNIFYMNQIIQYGKLVTVLQADPRDANQTIMSNFVVMAIKERSWDERIGELQKILKGESMVNKGLPGLRGGVPSFTQDLTRQLATLLEGGAGS